MSLLDTLLEAARFIELQERRIQEVFDPTPTSIVIRTDQTPQSSDMGSQGTAACITIQNTQSPNSREIEVQPQSKMDTNEPIQNEENRSTIDGNSKNQSGFVSKDETPMDQSDTIISSEADINTTQVEIQQHVQKFKTVSPKKMWNYRYLQEEPESALSFRVTDLSVTCGNNIGRPETPLVTALAVPSVPTSLPVSPLPLLPVVEPNPIPVLSTLQDFGQEHSKQRVTNNLGPIQIPSPTSASNSNNGGNGSNGVPRAGTREVHNKLEKNRRAHLKECFELLKRQLPATPEDKKTSNLSILGSAIRYIQVLRRKERECEHEIQRLARDKIAAQQRLTKLKREVPLRPATRHRRVDRAIGDADRSGNVNGNVILGTALSISSSPPHPVCQPEVSPSHNVNMVTKIRSGPLQLSPAAAQVVRTSYGPRHNTLTLTSLGPVDTSTQNSQESVVTSTLGTLVQPAQIHLPITQVVGAGGLVVGPALQLLSTSGLRVLQTPAVHTNGVTAGSSMVVKESSRIATPAVTSGGVVVSSLTPLVVSQPAPHLLQTHTIAHKVVETQMVKTAVAPLTVSARYLSTASIVKPVVVVSSASSSST